PELSPGNGVRTPGGAGFLGTDLSSGRDLESSMMRFRNGPEIYEPQTQPNTPERAPARTSWCRKYITTPPAESGDEAKMSSGNGASETVRAVAGDGSQATQRSGERGRNRTYNLLIKSYVSSRGCTMDNCSRDNNLTIKRPAWTASKSVGKVGEIEPHLTAKDTKRTQRALADSVLILDGSFSSVASP